MCLCVTQCDLVFQGGVSLDLTHMSTITAVHEEDFDAEVEAGVTRLTLNSYLRDTGLWFPIGQYVYPVL